jgi:hypothetical protein
MEPKYETLQRIVDQLEFCGYQTKDGLHELSLNAAFVALKEKATAELAVMANGHLYCKRCTKCFFAFKL